MTMRVIHTDIHRMNVLHLLEALIGWPKGQACRGVFRLGWLIALTCNGHAAVFQDLAETVNRASIEIQRGELQRAEDRLRAAVARGARNSEVYNLLGVICDQTRKDDEAIGHFQKALELAPGSGRARNNLGAYYFRRGQLEQALTLFKQVLDSDLDGVTANQNLGLIYLRQSKPAEALTYLEKARLLKSQDAGILFHLARCYFELGRDGKALQAIQEILAVTIQSDGATFYSVGALLLQYRQYGRAIEFLERARNLSAGNPLVLASLVEAYANAHQAQKSMHTLREFVEVLKQVPGMAEQRKSLLTRVREQVGAQLPENQASYEHRYLLAEILYLEKEYIQCRDRLSELGSAGARDPNYFNLLGMAYGGLNQLPQAAQAVIKGIQLAPKRADLVFNLAGLYQKAGDNASAIKVLKEALAQGKVSPQIHFAMGLSYFNMGNFSAAIESFQSSIKLDPGFQRAHFDLGRSFAKLGKATDALNAYRSSLAINVDFYPAHYEIALLLLGQQKTSEAVQQLKEVIRLQPQHADGHYQLGKIFFQQGQTEAAAAELEKAVACNVGHDGAHQALARLYLQIGDRKRAEKLLAELAERKRQRQKAFEERVSGAR
jgi:tetratricopeptide (TPR) repeat protein